MRRNERRGRAGIGLYPRSHGDSPSPSDHTEASQVAKLEGGEGCGGTLFEN